MKELFEKLDEDKKLAIINSGLEVFGKYGFQKSSTDLIASKAGISKGLLFYYFKNKQAYFLYLFEYAQKIISNNIDMDKCKEINDFFEMLEYLTIQKCEILSTYPHILNFIVTAYNSKDERVANEIQNRITNYNKISSYDYLNNIDKSKFKNEEDIGNVIEMLSLMLDGYLQNQLKTNQNIDINEIMKKYKIWTSILKEAVYK